MSRIFALLIGLTLATTGAAVAAEPHPLIEELQRGLAFLGYYDGPQSGVIDARTRGAIAAFEEDEGQPVSGAFSRQLLFEVNVAARLEAIRRTPEGQEREEVHQLALALPWQEFLRFVEEEASPRDALRMSWLSPERMHELPLSVVRSKGLLAGVGADEAGISMMLRQLLYPAAPEGIGQFQEDIEAPATGELTVRQFEELRRRWQRTRETPVYVDSVGNPEITIVQEAGVAWVEGTWVLDGDVAAAAVNRSAIACDREAGRCEDTAAEISITPALDQDADSYFLRLNTRRYAIVAWDAAAIVAEARSRCRTATLTLDLASHEVTEVTTNDDACKETDRFLRPLQEARIARLVAGHEATRDFWRERREVTRTYLNPRVAAKDREPQ